MAGTKRKPAAKAPAPKKAPAVKPVSDMDRVDHNDPTAGHPKG